MNYYPGLQGMVLNWLEKWFRLEHVRVLYIRGAEGLLIGPAEQLTDKTATDILKKLLSRKIISGNASYWLKSGASG